MNQPGGSGGGVKEPQPVTGLTAPHSEQTTREYSVLQCGQKKFELKTSNFFRHFPQVAKSPSGGAAWQFGQW